MKNLKSPFVLFFTALAVVCLHVSAWGQSDDKRIANVSASGLSVRWDVSASNAGLTLTISAPDGQVFSKEFKSSPAEFRLTDSLGEKLPDGQYTYELRVIPVISAETKETLSKARAKGNDADVERDLRKRGLIPVALVESGGFSLLNGSVVVAGASERDQVGKVVIPNTEKGQVRKVLGQSRTFGVTTGTMLTRRQLHHAFLNPMPDFVIADDLIVQGSACVGLDCVDGEVFGFDTIRLKENNTRLQFDDTSTSAGFATNNWQIRANAQGSGGASFLGVVDQGATGNSETGTIIVQFDAGASANSLRVSNVGRIGNKTATPVLDFHTNTSNTPAIRLEQNNTGGFTAQTWDIGANEANFFVRDVTSGSLLPLRIRPGAPTSSVDISADGDTGIGTGSPAQRLHVHGTITGLPATSGTAQNGIARLSQTGGVGVVDMGFGGASGAGWIQSTSSSNLATNFQLLLNPNGGNVGIGTTAPTQLLSVNGTAGKPGGGTWDVFSDERLKKIKGPFNTGLKAVMQLQPIRYEYKSNNALGIKSEGEHVGFGAQSLKQIIPEAVSSTDNGYLMVNSDPIIWSMLNAIKEQQKEIEQLKTEVRRLRATSRKRK